jgi:hypothetical protein
MRSALTAALIIRPTSIHARPVMTCTGSRQYAFNYGGAAAGHIPEIVATPG